MQQSPLAPQPRSDRPWIAPQSATGGLRFRLEREQARVGAETPEHPRVATTHLLGVDVHAIHVHASQHASVAIAAARTDVHLATGDTAFERVPCGIGERLPALGRIDAGESHTDRRARDKDADRVAIVHGHHATDKLRCARGSGDERRKQSGGGAQRHALGRRGDAIFLEAD